MLLLHLFALGFYTIYFIVLVSSAYLLHRYYFYFSYIVFFLLFFLAVILINLNIYDEYLFELYLYFDVVDKNIYINKQVMYALIALHLIVLINLKKFENFWDIIDKKLFRI